MVIESKTFVPIHIGHTSPNQGGNENENENVLSKIKDVSNSPVEAKVLSKFLAAYQGAKVRKEIHVSTKSGVIHTQIKNITNLKLQPDTPVSIIRSNMAREATYDSLTIKNGRKNLDVLNIKDGELPKTVTALMSEGTSLPDSGAFINGGFFIHRDGLLSADGNNCSVGFAIGETKGKVNVVPVPEPWKDVYGAVKDKDGKVLLRSAPILEKNANFESDRFKYRVVDNSQKPNGELVPNPLNILAGALGHSGDKNERAAISVGPKDVMFHTLTTKNGKRETGMKMKSWNDTVTSRGPEMEHLNLDGASSINMGIISNDGTKIENISKGGGVGNNDRSVASILITSPS